jgi:platelet-activating factor acetylhydrolase IB subunit alpha
VRGESCYSHSNKGFLGLGKTYIPINEANFLTATTRTATTTATEVMVLTDRQRSDLHAGIYEYLCSRTELSHVAEAMRNALPLEVSERYNNNNNSSSNSNSNSNHTVAPPTSSQSTTGNHNNMNGGTNSISSLSTTIPLLEKKWTAIPRLQKRVMELEKQMAQSAKIHAHRGGSGSGNHHVALTAENNSCRMLPRLPPTHMLVGHSMVITCCTVHPIFTIAISGSEDGTIKV